MRGRGRLRGSLLLAVSTCAVLVAVAACSSNNSAGGGRTSDGSSGGSAGADGSPINIGVIGAFSGPLGSAGTADRDGVLAWVQTINASGGINGHPVKAYVEDDKNDPATSTQALRTLVESDHVVALVGTYGLNTDQTWGDYLIAHKVPVVGGQEGSDIWNSNPMYFGASFGTSVKIQAYLLGPKAMGATKIYAMYCVEIAGCAADAHHIEEYAHTDGVAWAGSGAVSASGANYASACLQAKNSGATAVAAILPQSVFQRVAEACHQQGFDPVYASNSTVLSPDSLKAPYLNGKSFTYLAAVPIDSPAAADYVAAMKKYYPSVNLSVTEGQVGWTGGALFRAALQDVPRSATVTSADVINGLNRITTNNLGGLLPQGITFKSGMPHAQSSCIFTAHIKNEELVSDDKPLCASGG